MDCGLITGGPDGPGNTARDFGVTSPNGENETRKTEKKETMAATATTTVKESDNESLLLKTTNGDYSRPRAFSGPDSTKGMYFS